MNNPIPKAPSAKAIATAGATALKNQWLVSSGSTSNNVMCLSSSSTGTSSITWTNNPTTIYNTPNQTNIVVNGSPSSDGVVAAPREFNRYVNASDMVEDFIEWLGIQRVRQGEVMKLPLELFVKWLIVRACEADDEEPPIEAEVKLSSRVITGRKRCHVCQQFMEDRVEVELHAECAPIYFSKQQVRQLSA